MNKQMICAFDAHGTMHRVATVYIADDEWILVAVHYPDARICNEESAREDPRKVQDEIDRIRACEIG